MENKNNLKTVTVVIPCRNENQYIGKCLDSFINQSYPKEYVNIFVCDGLSTDGTVEIIKVYEEKYENVFYVQNKGLTAPKAMNLGIKKSDSDIIIIFGSHAFADKEFIAKNVELLNRDDSIGCSGGTLETINENTKGEGISLAMSSPFGVGNALFRYGKEEKFVDTVAFGAYPRAVLNKIGFFDEELVRNQDDELNFRVVKAGYKILLSPGVKSSYYSRSSLGKLWKQYFQYGFWKVRVMQKHGKVAALRHLVPMLFVIINILGAILSLFSKPILVLWLIEITLYIILNLIFSVKLCKEKIKLLRYVPVTFLILHMSYGLGFLEGLFAFYVFKSKNKINQNTKMSR